MGVPERVKNPETLEGIIKDIFSDPLKLVPPVSAAVELIVNVRDVANISALFAVPLKRTKLSSLIWIITSFIFDSGISKNKLNIITYDFEENPDFCKGSLVSDELFRKMGDALRYSKQLSTACAKAIDTSDVTEVAGIMKSELRLAKLFNTTDTIEFMRRTFKDVSDRIMDKEREKGVEFTDNSEFRNQLFDDEAR